MRRILFGRWVALFVVVALSQSAAVAKPGAQAADELAEFLRRSRSPSPANSTSAMQEVRDCMDASGVWSLPESGGELQVFALFYSNAESCSGKVYAADSFESPGQHLHFRQVNDTLTFSDNSEPEQARTLTFIPGPNRTTDELAWGSNFWSRHYCDFSPGERVAVLKDDDSSFSDSGTYDICVLHRGESIFTAGGINTCNNGNRLYSQSGLVGCRDSMLPHDRRPAHAPCPGVRDGEACRCADGYSGNIADSDSFPWAMAVCEEAACDVPRTTGRGLECRCQAGFNGEISWTGDAATGECVAGGGGCGTLCRRPSGSCIDNSMQTDGGACRCQDAFEGDIAWHEDGWQGACIPASCGEPLVNRDQCLALTCKCMGGYSGSITWSGGHCNSSGCTIASCNVSNSILINGSASVAPECRCKDAYTGGIWWADGSWHGEGCEKMGCNTIHSNGHPGPECACGEGYSGNITWSGNAQSGECLPVMCTDNRTNHGNATNCDCRSGYAGHVTWSGAVPNIECAPAPTQASSIGVVVVLVLVAAVVCCLALWLARRSRRAALLEASRSIQLVSSFAAAPLLPNSISTTGSSPLRHALAPLLAALTEEKVIDLFQRTTSREDIPDQPRVEFVNNPRLARLCSDTFSVLMGRQRDVNGPFRFSLSDMAGLDEADFIEKQELLHFMEDQFRNAPWAEHRTACLSSFSTTDTSFLQSRLTVMPVWHGSNEGAIGGIATNGFASLAAFDSDDPGWYGNGRYNAVEAELACMYASSYPEPKEANANGEHVVLLSAAIVGAAYPITPGREDYPLGPLPPEEQDQCKFYSNPLRVPCDTHIVGIDGDSMQGVSPEHATYHEVVSSQDFQLLPLAKVYFKAPARWLEASAESFAEEGVAGVAPQASQQVRPRRMGN